MRREPKRLWLDLGDLGVLVDRGGAHPQWQDHGMGLLRTILHAHGVKSYTFPVACEAARIFKAVNPGGLVPGPREGLPVALGARMRVGPVAGRDGSHEPGVPVAVCVLQRELLHPEHGAPGPSTPSSRSSMPKNG